MRVMYWNSTSPALEGNQFAEEKKNFIGNVVNTIAPDIVCLDEISGGIKDESFADKYAQNYLNGASGNFSSGAVVSNPGVHLNTATWIREGTSGYKKAETGLPSSIWDSDKTKRDLTKVTMRVTETKTITLWFLHANASPSGGKHAVELACTEVKKGPSVVIGDFNCPIAKAGGQAVAPSVDGHPFTQWKTDAHGSATVPNHLPPVKYNPHDIIDFAVCDSSKVTVTAVETVHPFGDAGFLGMIRAFDHFPVAYDIN